MASVKLNSSPQENVKVTTRQIVPWFMWTLPDSQENKWSLSHCESGHAAWQLKSGHFFTKARRLRLCEQIWPSKTIVVCTQSMWVGDLTHQKRSCLSLIMQGGSDFNFEMLKKFLALLARRSRGGVIIWGYVSGPPDKLHIVSLKVPSFTRSCGNKSQRVPKDWAKLSRLNALFQAASDNCPSRSHGADHPERTVQSDVRNRCTDVGVNVCTRLLRSWDPFANVKFLTCVD